MRFLSAFAALGAITPVLISAWPAADLSGYHKKWQDNFEGPRGSLPDAENFKVFDESLGVNNEQQTYKARSTNLQRSGWGTLQIIPTRDTTTPGGWASGRIESRYYFTPAEGKSTVIESMIRFGHGAPQAKAGIWPAFWILGDSMRHGTEWPQCGELDIMEMKNGVLQSYGTAHCGSEVCKESEGGITNTVNIPDQDWHRWAIQWNRTRRNWQDQTITWYMDGTPFHKITGRNMGSEVWKTLADSNLYFTLNVAVGGDWPGNAQETTLEGAASMMEVAYVTVFESN